MVCLVQIGVAAHQNWHVWRFVNTDIHCDFICTYPHVFFHPSRTISNSTGQMSLLSPHVLLKLHPGGPRSTQQVKDHHNQQHTSNHDHTGPCCFLSSFLLWFPSLHTLMVMGFTPWWGTDRSYMLFRRSPKSYCLVPYCWRICRDCSRRFAWITVMCSIDFNCSSSHLWWSSALLINQLYSRLFSLVTI